jgi:hypothetical protein
VYSTYLSSRLHRIEHEYITQLYGQRGRCYWLLALTLYPAVGGDTVFLQTKASHIAASKEIRKQVGGPKTVRSEWRKFYLSHGWLGAFGVSA